MLWLVMNPLIPAIGAIVLDQNGSNTALSIAGNGVPVVNIATPNGAGVSHNQYDQYDVGQEGLILNNSTLQFDQSQLGGILSNNPNLSSNANLIINEVTGANRSQLNGYTEVFGQQAGVVVANPYGITCNGCGFINTPNVTLTTGIPELDALGQLESFQVQGGDITIGINGLDTSNQQTTDIYAQAIKLNGAIHAQDLTIVAGTNSVSTDAQVLTTDSATSSPAISIDSTLLGGMYAGKITLRSTAEGVGVNLPSDLVATTEGIHIDSNGKLSLGGSFSAGNTQLTATAEITLSGDHYASNELQIESEQLVTLQAGSVASGADVVVKASAVNLSNSQLVAGMNENGTLKGSGDLQLNASDVTLQSSQINSAQTIQSNINSLNVDSLSSISSVEHTIKAIQTLNNDGQIVATDNISVTGEDYQLSGEGILFSDTLSMDGDTIDINTTIGTESQLAIETNTLNINNNGQVFSQQNVSLVASKILISGVVGASHVSLQATELSASTQSQITATNHVDIEVVNLENAGWIEANSLSVNADSMDNKGVILASTELDITANKLLNSGEILSNHVLSISASDILNEGNVQALGSLSIVADNIINGGEISATGLDIAITDALINSNSAIIQSTDTILINAKTVSNSGRIAASNDITINATQSINQQGSIHSAQSLLANAGSTLTNSGEILTLLDVNLNAAEQQLNSGEIEAGGDIFLSSERAAVVNQGDVIANGNLSIDSYQSLTNEQTLNAKNGITLLSRTGTLNNSGQIVADGALSLNSKADLTLNGGMTAGSDLSIVTTGNIVNQSKLQAGEDISLTSINFTNQSTASVLSGEKLTVQASSSINNQGAMVAGQDMLLTSHNINNNNSLLYAGRNMTLRAANVLDNSYGEILANNNLTIQGNATNSKNKKIINSSGNIQTLNGNITINTDHLLNNRAVFDLVETNDDSAVFAPIYISLDDLEQPDFHRNPEITSESQVLVNSASKAGTIIAATDMSINATQIDNYYSLLHANANMALSGASLNNLSAQTGTQTTHYIYQADSHEYGGDDFIIIHYKQISTEITQASGTAYQGTISARGNISASFSSVVDNSLLSPYSGAQTVQDKVTDKLNIGASQSASQGSAAKDNTRTNLRGLNGISMPNYPAPSANGLFHPLIHKAVI